MKPWTIAATVGAGLGAVALGMSIWNSITWPRGRPSGRLTPKPSGRERRVSILIPARNEEDTIEVCVRSALAQTHPFDEVVVFDDDSTDATPEILADLQRKDQRLRVVKGGEGLPDGWVGKPHACHNLARAACGEVLVFVDADTFLSDTGLARVASLFEDLDADLVTAVPRQITGSFVERLILPLLHVTYTSWFPLMLTWRSKDVRFLAANGQVLAIDRQVYDEVGGFEAVRDEVVDDMALCRRVKEHGRRVVFADGHEIASCRMYANAGEVWEGFSKNIYEGLGASLPGLGVVLGLYGSAFVLPYIALAAAPQRPELLAPGAAGVAANVGLRALLTARFRHAPEGIILHPLAVLGLLGIALNSARWHFKGTIHWSGRTYTPKKMASEKRTPKRSSGNR